MEEWFQLKSSVGDVRERKGKDGRVGWYITTTRSIPSIPSLEETRVHLYRHASPASPTSSSTPPPTAVPATTSDPDFSIPFLPTSEMLFRFSALTLNTHKIHYDHLYVTLVEGKPGSSPLPRPHPLNPPLTLSLEGILVHGPPTALPLLTSIRHSLPSNKYLKKWEYRATSPLAVNTPVRFEGKCTEEGVESWCVGEEDGRVYMSGRGEVGEA